MKSPIISSLFALGLTLTAPTLVLAHAGHGDEFQAKGGIQRVKVNPDTDSMLGIAITPIAQASSAGVMIPVTALVEADGKKLVFVQYENFYEPVPVTTGATKGDLIEVTKGLSVGEKLVTQGSLSLFAESRKTQGTTAASPSPAASPAAQAGSTPKSEQAHAQAHAQGAPHGHTPEQSGAMSAVQSGSPFGMIAAVAGGAVLLAGAIAVVSRRKQ